MTLYVRRTSYKTPSTIPATPVISSVVSGNTTLTANWALPDDGGAVLTSQEIRVRVTSPQGSWTTTTGLAAGATSHQLTSLTNGEGYDVQIRAVNSVGNSSWSATVTGTPAAVTDPTVRNAALVADGADIPAGEQVSGDLLIVALTGSQQGVGGPAIGTLSGWTEIGTQFAPTTANKQRQRWFRKTSTAVAETVTATNNTNVAYWVVQNTSGSFTRGANDEGYDSGSNPASIESITATGGGLQLVSVAASYDAGPTGSPLVLSNFTDNGNGTPDYHTAVCGNRVTSGNTDAETWATAELANWTTTHVLVQAT